MHTGAMGKGRIFSSDYEELLVPHSLHNNLLSKARCNLAHNTSIIRQYRHKQKAIDRFLLEEELYEHLSGTSMLDYGKTVDPNDYARLRADSKVRFEDEEAILENEEKEVIGGNTGSSRPTNGTSSRHFRTLTPLSDSSDNSFIGQINGTRSTIDGEMSSLAAPPKKFFSNSDRPREISDVSPVSFLVSNSSLEQWLQGSTSDIGALDGKESNVRNANVVEIKDEKKDAEPIGLPPVVPPHTVSVTTTAWSNKSMNRTTKINETHESHEKVDTATAQVLDSESLHSRRATEREMSEDERFIFDYGDIESSGTEGAKNKHAAYGINHGSSENSSTKNERTRLLE